ncbi:hypothetical protein [Nostoc sp. DedQUE07]|uniref:hypothetical protein n=1 Tax=Nostoc sp. DedQUE07 TaxID=3075392 RepID=UPI002AD58D38|nr:hypothetical protein [Nostoc sp. DedQUE07]MDZ8133589.1 hypothetical protein [Nostoc sp. DedQUE07]
MNIVDTGFWLALIDKKDTHHERAKQALKLLWGGRLARPELWAGKMPTLQYWINYFLEIPKQFHSLIAE